MIMPFTICNCCWAMIDMLHLVTGLVARIRTDDHNDPFWLNIYGFIFQSVEVSEESGLLISALFKTQSKITTNQIGKGQKR